MAIKGLRRNKEKEIINEKPKVVKKPNWLLRITIGLISIPFIILIVILLTSMEKTGEPIIADRFNNQINPKIKENDIKKVKESLTFDNVEKVEVNLKSATLRINIDTNNELDSATIEKIANDAYDKVNGILKIDTYFTNKTVKDGILKMYDLEINVYNFVPEDATRANWLFCVKHKNATEEAPGMDWPSKAKNEEVVKEVKQQGKQKT